MSNSVFVALEPNERLLTSCISYEYVMRAPKGFTVKSMLTLLLLALFFTGLLDTDAGAQQRIAASYPGIAGYNIPFWVALDAGEFKKAGLEVDPVLISGGSKSMQALLSGGLEFAHVSGGVSVQANLSGADVTIIGTGSNSMSAGIIAAKEIKSYQDLKGKKVGIASFGGNNDIGFRFAFRKNGINPDKDVTFLQLGGERNRLTALERGVISATIMSPPGLFVAEGQGYSRLGDLNAMGMRYPELSIVTRKRDLEGTTRRGPPIFAGLCRRRANDEEQPGDDVAGHREVHSCRFESGGDQNLRLFCQKHIGYITYRPRRDYRISRHP